MGRNLDPTAQALHTILKKGVLVVLPRRGGGNTDTTVRALRFQYNPDTMTRARTGQWEALKNNLPVSNVTRNLRDGHRGGGLYASSETISLKLVFDVTEEILRSSTSRADGVLPELGFLETVALGGDQAKRHGDRRQQPAQNSMTEAAPAECILAIGDRLFPVVLTTLTIIEKRFLPTLVPIRAECDCKFRVLEPTEIQNNASVQAAFVQLAQKRRDRRDIAAFTSGGSGSGGASSSPAPADGPTPPDQDAIEAVIRAALESGGGAR